VGVDRRIGDLIRKGEVIPLKSIVDKPLNEKIRVSNEMMGPDTFILLNW